MTFAPNSLKVRTAAKTAATSPLTLDVQIQYKPVDGTMMVRRPYCTNPSYRRAEVLYAQIDPASIENLEIGASLLYFAKSSGS